MYIIPAFISFMLFIQNTNLSDQWTEYEIQKGDIEVRSRISRERDKGDKKVLIIEYEAKTAKDISLSSCLALIENVEKHKEFLERTEISRIISHDTSDEWLIYYYVTQPWPLPDADAVTILKKTIRDSGKIISYYGYAAPDLYEDQGVKRMKINEVTYTFKKLGPDKVEILMQSRFSPTVSAPDWMINTWFPEGPANILSRFIELARQI